MIRSIYALVLLGTIALLVAVALEIQGNQQEPGSAGLGLDPQAMSAHAPDFSLHDRKGRVVSSKELHDHWVLVNFWASWCKPCLEELPHLSRLALRLGSKAKLVLISVDASWKDVDRLMDRLKESAPKTTVSIHRMLNDGLENTWNLLDPGATIAHKFGTLKFPETYLMDPSGRLRQKYIGPKPWGTDKIIHSLLRQFESSK
jgi:thiol-disulfide isomerase/thioredoxin